MQPLFRCQISQDIYTCNENSYFEMLTRCLVFFFRKKKETQRSFSPTRNFLGLNKNMFDILLHIHPVFHTCLIDHQTKKKRKKTLLIQIFYGLSKNFLPDGKHLDSLLVILSFIYHIFSLLFLLRMISVSCRMVI